MKRAIWAVVLATALVAVPALAVSKGGKLYIKTKDANLMAKPDAKSKVVTKLQPGDSVTWNGAAAEDKRFHEVETAKKKKGYVLQANLSPNEPQKEVLLSSGKPIDAKSFASSGAATKALTEAGLKYAERKGKDDPKERERLDRAAKSIISAEAVADSIGPAKAQQYGCKSTGVCP